MLGGSACERARSCAGLRLLEHSREGSFGAGERAVSSRGDGDETLGPISGEPHGKAGEKRVGREIDWSIEWQGRAAVASARKNTYVLCAQREGCPLCRERRRPGPSTVGRGARKRAARSGKNAAGPT